MPRFTPRVVGLLVNALVVWPNWEADDWTHRISVIAFGLSSTVMVPVFVIAAGILIDPPPI
jgi:hypothetical protein